MFIANPIYDAVFNYLIEDERVARIVISTIIDEEIEELCFTPRERTAQIPTLGVTVFRLDFSAVIRTADGERKNVLINLYKADRGDDLQPFPQDYHEPPVQSADTAVPLAQVLPIISVYILGEPLPELRGYSAVKVKRGYFDAVTGEPIVQRDPFIESLSHDTFVVQISELNLRRRNRLEKLLALFEQRNRQANRHLKQFTDTLPKEFEPVLYRLLLAATDPKVLSEMEAEEDVLVPWKRRERKLQKQLEEQRQQKEEPYKQEEEAPEREDSTRKRAIKALMALGMSEEGAAKRLAGED